MGESRRTDPELGAIRAVTCAVPDLDRIEKAYTRFLGYRVIERGQVPRPVADSWAAPAVAGRAYMTMEPASRESVHLRFVESTSAAGWRALTTHGWNATEIVVENVDALAATLVDSPFRMIGPPQSLQRFPMIRAMQVLGPAGECLYFTQIGAGAGLELAAARSFVGRVFIVVAGGADLSAMFAAYARFTNQIDPPVKTQVEVISRANGLPPETEHAHGLIKLPRGTLIELDGYPDVTTPRWVARGELPPGMAIVSFEFPQIEKYIHADPCAQGLLPGVRRAVTLKGFAGELIELVEPDDDR
jgi:catechol 2,3-dioxygenase-like lactoylglutathione lyase family enzyme